MNRFAFALLFVPVLACASGPTTQMHMTSHANGVARWQVPLVDGVPDGPSVTWHPNGKVASRGAYRDGKREGEFVYWDADGREVRRELFRADALVWSSSPAPGDAVGEAPVDVDVAPPPAERGVANVVDIRVIAGMGGTTSTRRTDGPDDEGAYMALTGSVLARRGRQVFGATSQLGSTLFGPEHRFVGGVYGLSTQGSGGAAQLLFEGGLHRVTNVGDDLFATANGDDEAILPYVGAQFRVTMDPGDEGAFIVDLAMSARSDLGSETRSVTVNHCLFGCSTERETWRVGGHSFDVSVGLGYRF